ncbi:NAD(P)-dependent oxidoreductase [Paraliomyxa miuraensis]|uniref:NAD(P)-dependent oxidoreductase n=1 Tax=Paraliomyxa miuraensis TaxID=376150 RepID=UPI00224CCC4F|nr:NAD(P)-dependent oxidoreductase [Paraliomyxa miuraensis]MCX4247251.1 NAD(P)-dependent oxidoreductase [Paraliomyxa miuraensis]
MTSGGGSWETRERVSVAEDPQRAENRDRAEDAHRRLLEGAQARALAETGTTRVERVIIGGGLAATLCWATGARCEGLVVARAEEPWWSRGRWRLGQPSSELVSEGFVLQPHEFAEDVDGFAPASALANAIAVTAHEHGMPLVLGCCVERPIERIEDGRFVVWVGERRIEAERVDVAVGLGPPRRLRDRDGNATIVTEEDERELLADGRMVFGQDQWRHEVRGPRVLVFGGGATAAWNVERALSEGAKVTWVAPLSRSDARDHAQKVRAIEEELTSVDPTDRARLRQLERERARIVAFHRADLPRTQAVFEAEGVDLWVGSLERLVLAADGVEAELLREDHRERQRFDQVVVSIGQDDRAPEASSSLVAKLRMTWIEYDGDGTRAGSPARRPVGRIVGACATDGPTRLRCFGAPLLNNVWQKQLEREQPRKSRGFNPLRARLEQQVGAAPTCSRGIEGAAFHIGANVVLANETPLDPGLGEERYELLLSTFRQHQGDLATSRGDGG